MATVVGLFDSRMQAERAVQMLRDSGYRPEDISIVMRDRAEARDMQEATGVGGATTAGVVGGGLLGGLAGFLVGIGALAIPGIGPIIAAGPLVAALTGGAIGATAGGLIGALVDAGVPEEEARYYQTGVERGGILLAVKVPDGQEAQARTILQQAGMRNVREDAAMWERNPEWRYGQETGGSATGETAGGAVAGGATGAVIGGVVGGPPGAVIGGLVGGTAGAATGAAIGEGRSPSENDRADEGGAGGALAGGVAGAAIGTAAAGPVGTVVGGALGGAAGAATGAAAGESMPDNTATNAPAATTNAPSTGATTAGGAVAGGAAGAALGAVVGGPPGAVVGGATGAVLGGATGAAAAPDWNTVEPDFRSNWEQSSHYRNNYTWEQISPAYRYGYESYYRNPNRAYTDIRDDLYNSWNTSYGSYEDFEEPIRYGYERAHSSGANTNQGTTANMNTNPNTGTTRNY